MSPKAVARWFVNHTDRDSGEVMTQLKLQKLVYYAEAWFLANFDRPLLSEDFEAWAHGPAVKSLYAKYRGHGWEPIPPQPGKSVPKELEPFLQAVYDEYGQYSAKKLERMTHEETPWLEARGALPPEAASRTVIPKVKIRNFYAARIEKEAIEQLQN
ncbi:hypothetical protein OCH239_12625 [Roseivivax halodurans JCM 10272]|uniref:Antitoxin SocA-like Panacea domain-containing protein n=1 Tax=Roseivivax halodurans JCM 10272 TaxID=1449350 RepID=X7EBM5_9RHOB|nr:hypothetical protein OCH239_12625 [Roseivivax halodurans JCM 10272]